MSALRAEAPRVLIVDEREEYAAEFTTEIEKVGLDPTWIRSIEEAIPMARERPALLALVHLSFDRCCGPAVAWVLRQITPKLRLLLYTGNPASPGIAVARKLDLAECLFDARSLRGEVSHVIRTALDAAVAEQMHEAALESLQRPSPNGTHEPATRINLNGLHQQIDEDLIKLFLLWQGSIRAAAHGLGLEPSTLYSKMKKLGIRTPGIAEMLLARGLDPSGDT